MSASIADFLVDANAGGSCAAERLGSPHSTVVVPCSVHISLHPPDGVLVFIAIPLLKP